MIKIYKCEFCGKVFEGESASNRCLIHEYTHKEDNYFNVKQKILEQSDEPCSFCNESWYVYNCERECLHNECNCQNYWKDFQPKI